jgi:hypothetical protein
MDGRQRPCRPTPSTIPSCGRANDLVAVVGGKVQAAEAGYDLRALIELQELRATA